MFCKNCGSKIDNDSNFCSECGIKLKSEINVPREKSNDSIEKENLQLNIEETFKYDLSYKKETSILILGIFFLFLPLIFTTAIYDDNTYVIFTIILLLIRIGVIFTIIDIAKKIDSDSDAIGWGVFGFFLPAIALIVIFFKKKKLYTQDYYSFSREKKSQYNNSIASRYLNAKRYGDGLKFVNAAINYDNNNHAAYDTRGVIYFYLKDYKNALLDLNRSINLEPNHGIKFYHRGYILKALESLDKAMEDWANAYELGYEKALIPLEKYKNFNNG